MVTRQRKTPDLLPELLAGSADAHQGHKEKLRRYSGAKAHTNTVAEYILQHEPVLHKEGELLQACSAWLVFRHFYLADQYRLIGGCTCKKHLLCAMCALRRSAKTVMVYAAKIKQVLEHHSQLVPVLITLTVKNGPDLKERTDHLEDAFKRMVSNRRYAKAGGRHQTIFRLVHGAAGAFEFKRGKNSGLWHPHIHLFALVPPDVDLMAMQWDMSEEWRKLTRDSHNVDVTPIDWTTEESKMKSVCEVFRYALKFGEMEISDQVHAYRILSGRRLVRDFGSLHGVVVSDDLHDTIEDELKLQPYVDLVYKYCQQKGYFLDHTTDTKDVLFTSNKPETSQGEKAARKLRRKLHLSVKDPEETDRKKINRKRSVDLGYVKAWVEKQPVPVYVPEGVPF